MSRKSKIEAIDKVKIVERCLSGDIGIHAAAKEMNVGRNRITDWIRLYEIEGPTSLLNQKKNGSYPKELKLKAVNDYLSGQGSLQDICRKYKIRSTTQLSQWIKVHNDGGKLKESTGGTSMKKSRQTTLQERLEIVKDYLENDKNYGKTALKYNCSYQQVRN